MLGLAHLNSAKYPLITCFLLVQLATPALASTLSDLLIAIETDGRSHTVQHTIGSNGPLVTLMLPGSVIPQEVRFIGPDQSDQTSQHRLNPRRLAIKSGAAFARYHHQYGNAVSQIAENEYELTTQSRPSNITVDGAELEDSSITWVFPSDFDITSYTVTNSLTGQWVVENNMLTFHQLSGEPVTLYIRYRLESKISNVGILGCKQSDTLVLEAIKFSSGSSYLEVKARQILDRAANAMQKHPDVHFEVAAHTDNDGAAEFNLRLSSKRAEAVRHYLMLKGVSPNNLRATGYGESYPVKDNSTAAGRRANRRIELTRLSK